MQLVLMSKATMSVSRLHLQVCVSVSLHFSSAVRNDLWCSLKPVDCFCNGIFIFFFFLFSTGDFKRITMKKRKAA